MVDVVWRRVGDIVYEYDMYVGNSCMSDGNRKNQNSLIFNSVPLFITATLLTAIINGM